MKERKHPQTLMALKNYTVTHSFETTHTSLTVIKNERTLFPRHSSNNIMKAYVAIKRRREYLYHGYFAIKNGKTIQSNV